jgi:hypothetical protein
MGWPLSIPELNFEVGPGQVVPQAGEALTATKSWLIGAQFSNTGIVQRTVTLKNAAGKVLAQQTIGGGADAPPYDWAFRPTLGLYWLADGPGLIGHIWGFQ